MNRDISRHHRELSKFTDLSDLKDVHVGMKCFICGAGPSIGEMDLSGIHKHVVISVNSSILLLDWLKGTSDYRYWISNDALCLQWDYFWEKVVKSKCTKLVRTSWQAHEQKILKYGFRYFAIRPSEKPPLLNSGKHLCGFSSVPTAIDLALLMGCKYIYLLGVDHKMIQGKSHFWQFWSKDRWPKYKGKHYNPEQSHQIHRFKRNKYVFMALRELANRLGAKIYNCSIWSTVTIFPSLSLDRALEI